MCLNRWVYSNLQMHVPATFLTYLCWLESLSTGLLGQVIICIVSQILTKCLKLETIIMKHTISFSFDVGIYSGVMPRQGHNRHIFLRGQSNFLWLFSQREMLFLVKNSHFGRPKTNFSHFEKWKAKKKKKKKKNRKKKDLFW